MKTEAKLGIAITAGGIAIVILFFLLPIIPFQCQTIYSTSGSVSLSCEVLGFGEIHQEAFGTSASAWSDSCQIHSSAFAECSAGTITSGLMKQEE